MAGMTEKYRLYLSGYEIAALLALTEPNNLDPSEITPALSTARVTLRKKLIEAEEGTATVDLVVKGPRPRKFSSEGLGFSSNPSTVDAATQIAAMDNDPAFWAKMDAAQKAAQAAEDAGKKLPDPFIDPAFNFDSEGATPHTPHPRKEQ
jgi:hypothetical protein